MAIKIYDAAIALMQAGFNVEFISPTIITLGIRAVKYDKTLELGVEGSKLDFKRCHELVKHCNKQVKKLEISGFELFKDDKSVFTFF